LTLVDTNVLIDILGDDPHWAGWSLSRMAAAGARGDLIIDPVTYAELSTGFPDIRELDAFIRRFRVELTPTPRAALFRAGRAFLAYRRSGGTRSSLLPDFLIGAHAEVAGLTILTRDIRRYRTYFPAVRLIAPDAP
jgi:predicted nucleic acid-binding protein